MTSLVIKGNIYSLKAYLHENNNYQDLLTHSQMFAGEGWRTCGQEYSPCAGSLLCAGTWWACRCPGRNSQRRPCPCSLAWSQTQNLKIKKNSCTILLFIAKLYYSLIQSHTIATVFILLKSKPIDFNFIRIFSTTTKLIRHEYTKYLQNVECELSLHSLNVYIYSKNVFPIKKWKKYPK